MAGKSLPSEAVGGKGSLERTVEEDPIVRPNQRNAAHVSRLCHMGASAARQDEESGALGNELKLFFLASDLERWSW